MGEVDDPAQAEDQHQQQHRQHQRCDRGVRQLLDDREEVTKKAALVDVDAKQLRDLVDHDHQADARLEAGEHRLGDEVGDEAEPQRGRGKPRGVEA